MKGEVDTVRAINPRKRLHYRGKYVIRTEWRGETLLYEVLTKSGMSVTAGLDMLSLDEQMALDGIMDRLGMNIA